MDSIFKKPILAVVVIWLLATLSFAEGPSAADLRTQGDKSFAAGDYETAMKTFQAAAKLEPAFPGGQYRIARTALMLKQPAIGIQSLDTITLLDPTLASNLALVKLRQDLEALRRADGEHALELPERSKQADELLRTAQQLEAEGKLQEADDAIRQVSAIDPNNGAARELSVKIKDLLDHQEKQRLEEAAQRQAAERSKRISDLLASAKQLSSAGEQEKALVAIDEALALDPQNNSVSELRKATVELRVQSLRGELKQLINEGGYDAAAIRLQSLVQLAPNDDYAQRAAFLIQIRRKPSSFEEGLKRCIASVPKGFDGLYDPEAFDWNSKSPQGHPAPSFLAGFFDHTPQVSFYYADYPNSAKRMQNLSVVWNCDNYTFDEWEGQYRSRIEQVAQIVGSSFEKRKEGIDRQGFTPVLWYTNFVARDGSVLVSVRRSENAKDRGKKIVFLWMGTPFPGQ